MILTIIIPTVMYGIGCQNGEQCIDTLYYTRDTATLHSTIGHEELISEKDFNNCSNYLPLMVAAIGVLAGGVCFKLGKIACKIMTQIVDYSLPFALSTPVAMGVVLAMYDGFMTTPPDDVSCAIPFPRWSSRNVAAEYFQWFTDDSDNLLLLGAMLCGFLSFLLVTNHVWMPGKERLQRTDR